MIGKVLHLKDSLLSSKAIFFPMSHHGVWSLFVVTNPGQICSKPSPDDASQDQPKSMILLLNPSTTPVTFDVDSACRKIRSTLNKLCDSIDSCTSSHPFRLKTLKLYKPEGEKNSCLFEIYMNICAHNSLFSVPSQVNQADNPLYILKYMHSCMLIKDLKFTDADISDNFSKCITKSVQFGFTPLDIWRIRSELYTFINRLSVVHRDNSTIQQSGVLIGVGARGSKR